MWTVWTATTLMEAASRLAGAKATGSAGAVQEGSQDEIKAGGEDSEEAVLASEKVKAAMGGKAKRDAGAALDKLDGWLAKDGGREYILGEFSLVDTHVWTLLSYVVDVLGVSIEGMERVKGWKGKVGARKAVKDL